MRALAKFGAASIGIVVEDLISPDTVLQIGVEPCRIDLLTGIDGVQFDVAWQNKSQIMIDDLELFVLSKPDLLQNKIAAGRDKDQGDIAWLRKNLDSSKT